MPSRQARRAAERDAAKRAPGQAGAGGAAGSGGDAAPIANLNVNQGGDWTTQAEDPYALFRAIGADIVKERARAGDREAQWSLGFQLTSEAIGAAGTPPGAASTSPHADVGFALRTGLFQVAHQTATRRCGYLITR